MLIRILFKLSLVFAVCFLLYTGLTRFGLPLIFNRADSNLSLSSVSPESVVMQLRELNELVSVKANIQTIVTTEDFTKLLGFPIASTKLLYVAMGEVRAGMDLSQMEVDQVSIKNSINVSLPQARILDTKIDINRSFVYDVRQSLFFSPSETPLQSAAQQEALKRIEKAAIDAGLLEQANHSAAEIVKKLVEDIVDKETIVVVE